MTSGFEEMGLPLLGGPPREFSFVILTLGGLSPGPPRYAVQVSFRPGEIVSLFHLHDLSRRWRGDETDAASEIDFRLTGLSLREKGAWTPDLAGIAFFPRFRRKEGIGFVIDSYGQATTYLNISSAIPTRHPGSGLSCSTIWLGGPNRRFRKKGRELPRRRKCPHDRSHRRLVAGFLVGHPNSPLPWDSPPSRFS